MDVIDLRDFYSQRLGIVARRLINRGIHACWPDAEGQRVLGIGYPTPYLGSFRGEARALAAFMPASQGAIIWPNESSVLTALIEDDRLPLADNSVDLMLAVHCLELSDSLRLLLREMWRVLKPEGRLLAIVPNRRGVWARLERTPFGHGRPYSASQLDRLLRDALFEPVSTDSALHMPPFKRPQLLGVARTIGRMSARIGPTFAGVILVEVRKEVSAPTGRAIRETAAELATAKG